MQIEVHENKYAHACKWDICLLAFTKNKIIIKEREKFEAIKKGRGPLILRTQKTISGASERINVTGYIIWGMLFEESLI